MNIDTSNHWVQQTTALRSGTRCIGGKTSVDGITFPEAVCNVGTLTKSSRADTPWEYTLISWYSATQIYALGHFTGIPTTLTTSMAHVVVNGKTGWLTQRNNVTSIVVPLANSETFVFATTVGASQSVMLAKQSLMRLNELAPLAH